MEKRDTAFNTSHEIDFIDGLGMHSSQVHSPRALLYGYLEGCTKRTDWGDIDKERVMMHAIALLDRKAA